MSYRDPEPVDPYRSPEAKDPGSYLPPVSQEERTWGMICHLSTFAGLTGFPFANVIAPLVVWLIKKDEMPFVDDQGKEALNFQISVTIYLIMCIILVFVLIGIPLLIALVIFDLVVTIIAAIKANSGEAYRYPLCIRFIA